jgi:hypothetical protein
LRTLAPVPGRFKSSAAILRIFVLTSSPKAAKSAILSNRSFVAMRWRFAAALRFGFLSLAEGIA